MSTARSTGHGHGTGAAPNPAPTPLADPAFLAHFNQRQCAKGELLTIPGDGLNQVFLLESGRLRVYIADGDSGKELSLAFLEPGELFSTHAPVYISAVAASTLRMLDTQHFARLLAEFPHIAPGMMRVLGRLLGNTIGLVEDIAFRDVASRLARFLAGLSERRGWREDDGWVVPLDLGTEDIACLLGTTRQTVSSLLNQWQRQGLLKRRGRRTLVIPDLSALDRQS